MILEKIKNKINTPIENKSVFLAFFHPKTLQPTIDNGFRRTKKNTPFVINFAKL